MPRIVKLTTKKEEKVITDLALLPPLLIAKRQYAALVLTVGRLHLFHRLRESHPVSLVLHKNPSMTKTQNMSKSIIRKLSIIPLI